MKVKKVTVIVLALALNVMANAQTNSSNAFGKDSTSLIPAQITLDKQISYSTGPQTVPGRVMSCGDATTETQSGDCPTGYTGSINYSRQVKQCSDGINGSTQATSWTQISNSCVAPPPPPACVTTQECTMRDALYQWVDGSLVKIPGSDGQGSCLQLMSYTYCNGVFQSRCNLTIGLCWNW